MTIRMVTWSEFFRICYTGFRATGWTLASLIVMIAATHFTPMALAWRDRTDRDRMIHDTGVYNSAIQGYAEHTIPAFTERDQRFMRFAQWMTNTRTKTERQRAYLSLLGGRNGVPRFAPNSVKQALNRPGLSTEARVRALSQDYSAFKGEHIHVNPSGSVGAATYAHLRGDHRRRGYQTRAFPVHNFDRAIKWEILFAAFLIYAAMAYSFLSKGGVERTWEESGFMEKPWALPANPGGWLIMTLYAPTFIFLWGFRIFLWIPGRYLMHQGKWLLTEVDFRNIGRYIQARRDAKERRLAEGARMAQIGKDVLERELQLSRARTVAERLSDPDERATILNKIKRAEDLLTHVKAVRLRNWKSTPAPPPTAPQQNFDELFVAIDALAEAEEVTPRN